MSKDEGRVLRLLLVEDNPGDARLFKEELKRVTSVSFDVHHVMRLAEAEAQVGEPGLDAVLLDLSLPDGQGLANIQRMVQAAPTLPLVVLTGTDDDELAMRAVHAGAQDYLVKGQVAVPALRRAIEYAILRQDMLSHAAGGARSSERDEPAEGGPKA